MEIKENPTGPKITLLAEKCWIIKSIIVDAKQNVVSWSYIESYKVFNKSPAFATIFQTMDAADQMIWCIKQVWKKKGQRERFDGNTEVFEVVSFYDEISNDLHGKTVVIKK
jgi:hypothetical protein